MHSMRVMWLIAEIEAGEVKEDDSVDDAASSTNETPQSMEYERQRPACMKGCTEDNVQSLSE